MQGRGSVEWNRCNNNARDDINERGNSWMCTICSKLQLVWHGFQLIFKKEKEKKIASHCVETFFPPYLIITLPLVGLGEICIC